MALFENKTYVNGKEILKFFGVSLKPNIGLTVKMTINLFFKFLNEI